MRGSGAALGEEICRGPPCPAPSVPTRRSADPLPPPLFPVATGQDEDYYGAVVLCEKYKQELLWIVEEARGAGRDEPAEQAVRAWLGSDPYACSAYLYLRPPYLACRCGAARCRMSTTQTW